MNLKKSRRSFIKYSTMSGVAAIAGKPLSAAQRPGNEPTKSLVFLFQGDSITDGNRGRNTDPNHIMGHGYAFAVAGRVGADFAASNHVFYNRGISGNKITDLQARWQTDTLDLKPNVLSILIGINDIAGFIKNGTEANAADNFENSYRNILSLSKTQNPDTLFVLCLPFVYKGSRVKDDLDKYNALLKQLRERIKKLSAAFNTVLVDFEPAFEKAFKTAPLEYWIWDGIHPTVPAHELMAREWIKQVADRLKFLKYYKS